MVFEAILYLAVLIIAAKLFGELMHRINQPTILDETVVQIKNNFQPMFDTFVQTPLFSPGFDMRGF